jgi:hypothetical protein
MNQSKSKLQKNYENQVKGKKRAATIRIIKTYEGISSAGEVQED